MKFVPTSSLSPHPLNDLIYKDVADEAFIDRVERLGIIQPLLVTEEGMIISGHRRLDAALKLDLPEVPVLVVPTKSRLDVEEMLIEANRHRRQTNEQLLREYQHLAQIEARRMAVSARQEQSDRDAQVQAEMSAAPEAVAVEPAPPEPVVRAPASDSLDDMYELPADFDLEAARRAARKAVARHVGRSQNMLDKGVSVVERIDDLHQEEKHDEASELRKVLNHRSVGAAFKKAYGTEEKAPDTGPPLRRMRKLAEDLEAWAEAGEGPQEALDALGMAVQHLRDAVLIFEGAAEAEAATSEASV